MSRVLMGGVKFFLTKYLLPLYCKKELRKLLTKYLSPLYCKKVSGGEIPSVWIRDEELVFGQEILGEDWEGGTPRYKKSHTITSHPYKIEHKIH